MSKWPTPSNITLIEQQKKSKYRYNIYINDEFAFSIHEDVLVKHRLFKGDEIDAEKLSQVIKDEEYQKAFIQAIHYISRKPRAKKEIEKKLLEKNYDQAVIHDVLHKLIAQKYVDDQDYAHTLTEYRIQTQKKGRKWIKQELISKGVSKEYIENAIEQIDEETEFRMAYELGKKRWDRQDGGMLDKKRKVGGFLLRRGYTNSLVNRVIRSLQGSDSDHDDEFSF